MKLDNTGKTALITGATRGIGASIAEVLHQSGARLILSGKNEEHIHSLKQELKHKGITDITYFPADFSNRDSLDKFIDYIKNLNGIDICINNAGINIIKPIDDVEDNDFDSLMDINLRAPYLISRAVSGAMKHNKYCRIVNIASIWSMVTKNNRSLYSASKTGLTGITRSFAVELAPYNILVNALSPGFILTELTIDSLTKDERTKLAEQVPLQRFGQPDEIANIVLFLCSDLNSYITGQNIVADGGFTCV